MFIWSSICKEMLCGLCSLQTNLCISLHHQSYVLWHHGTTCKELIFSSEIRNALGKSLQKVHLSSGQSNQKDNHMSCLPYVVLGGTSKLGTTECTCQGDLTCDCTCHPDLMKYQSCPLDAYIWGYMWLNVPARYLLLSSVSSNMLLNIWWWCEVVLLLATRCLYQGVHLSQVCLTEICLLNWVTKNVKPIWHLMSYCSWPLHLSIWGYIWDRYVWW